MLKEDRYVNNNMANTFEEIPNLDLNKLDFMKPSFDIRSTGNWSLGELPNILQDGGGESSTAS